MKLIYGKNHRNTTYQALSYENRKNDHKTNFLFLKVESK